MASRTAKVGVAKSPRTRTVTVPEIPEAMAVDIDATMDEAFPSRPLRVVGHIVLRPNKYGFRGISEGKRNGTLKWRSRIEYDCKRRHIGYYATKEEAARAYDKAAKIIYGDDAVLNFPED